MRVDSSRNVDSAYGEFILAIQGVARRTVPKSYTKRKFRPFWTSALERLVKQRKAARMQASRKKTAESRREYNRLTAEVRRAVSKAKLTKWTETCAKLDLADRVGLCLETVQSKESPGG